jgi:hypothetical protein
LFPEQAVSEAKAKTVNIAKINDSFFFIISRPLLYRFILFSVLDLSISQKKQKAIKIRLQNGYNGYKKVTKSILFAVIPQNIQKHRLQSRRHSCSFI